MPFAALEELNTREAAKEFFEQNFPSALSVVDEAKLLDDFERNPRGNLVTINVCPRPHCLIPLPQLCVEASVILSLRGHEELFVAVDYLHTFLTMEHGKELLYQPRFSPYPLLNQADHSRYHRRAGPHMLSCSVTHHTAWYREHVQRSPVRRS